MDNEKQKSEGVSDVRDLSDIAKLMATNPEKAIELMEKGIKEEMLGIYDIDLMRNYIGKRGHKVKINGVELYYETVGNGPHVVLLCPGTTGTIASDYLPQMLPGGFDREKYTLVSFEPRGYGSSCPPKRLSYPLDFQIEDVNDAIELMKILGHKRFSWVGWCAGGNAGVVAAAKYPDMIRSLIIWGAYPSITEKAYNAAKSIFRLIVSLFFFCIFVFFLCVEKLEAWSDKMLEPKLLQYEKTYLQSLFSELFKYKVKVYEEKKGDCVLQYLAQITCPTLVLDLKQDFFTERSQVDVLLKSLSTAKSVEVEDGKHAFHLKYPAKFRKILEEFLETVPA